MTTSSPTPDEVFVWIWLPGEMRPIVTGRLARNGDRVFFTYGQSYLSNEKAIPIYDEELPLAEGIREREIGRDPLFGCIRDGSPDAWGRRVIMSKLGKGDVAALDEFTYLLESGSDRIGALDFQESPENYIERRQEQASLEELLEASGNIEAGLPLSPALEKAIQYRTAIGGARPKAFIDDADKKYIAKFSSSADQYNFIKAEFIAMRLAQCCGINTAEVKLERAAGKDVLLVERFDRTRGDDGWARRMMISGLTIQNLDELAVIHDASYEKLAEAIRHKFTEPKTALRELFARMVYNILCGNNDDHPRNHAAFWDGRHLALTPAYDICPIMRTGGETNQAMKIAGDDKSARLATCLKAAASFCLDESGAREIIDAQVASINDNWDAICGEAGVGKDEEAAFRKFMFLNDFAFEGS